MAYHRSTSKWQAFPQNLTCTELGDVPKRHCSGGSWAYQRVVSGDLAARDIRPVIHPSKPGDNHHPARHPLAHGDADSSSQAEERQRQFYMSRTPFVTSPESPVQANKKRRYSAAVFIERDTKKQGIPTTQRGPDSHAVAAEPVSARQGPPPGAEASQPPAGPEDMDVDSEVATNEPRALKRPGKSSRVKQPTGEKGGTPSTAPAPAPLPQFHGDMDKVAAAMSAWTVDEIQRNLDDIEHRQTAPAHPASRDALRFQPRVPARRYAERHPQQGEPAVAPPGRDTMTLDTHQNSDGEWVEVVYHRVPASKIDGTIPRGEIGVIVFEDEEEKEYFYDATEGDSDDDFQDEDDENGMFATQPLCFLGISQHGTEGGSV